MIQCEVCWWTAWAADIATICGAAATIVAVVVAIIYGRKTYTVWKEELTGTDKYQLALKIYKSVYTIQDLLLELRTPVMPFGREEIPPEAEDYFADDHFLEFEISILTKRLDSVNNTLADLKTFEKTAEVLLDEEVVGLMSWLRYDIATIVGKTHRYKRRIISLANPESFIYMSRNINEVWADYKEAFYDPKTDEKYPPEIDENIALLEEKLKIYLLHK